MKTKRNKIPALTKAQKDEFTVLAGASEKDIDTGELSELTADDFTRAVRFHDLFKPRKVQVTARIDADVLFWLKGKGKRGYQSRLNAILRVAMAADVEAKDDAVPKRSEKGPQSAQKGSAVTR